MYDLKSFLFSPYPALPPNVVRRLHLHGGRTTAENYPSLLLHSTERDLGDVWVCGFFRAHGLDVCRGRMFRTCGAEADVCSARKAPRRPPEDLKAARRRLNMAPARSEDGSKTGRRWLKTAPWKCHAQGGRKCEEKWSYFVGGPGRMCEWEVRGAKMGRRK